MVYLAGAGSIGEESEKRDGEGEGANGGRELSHKGSALDSQRSLGNRGGSQGLSMVSLKWGGAWGVYTPTLGGAGAAPGCSLSRPLASALGKLQPDLGTGH